MRGAGGHLVAGAGHRHGRDRSGRPDRSAAVGGERAAAHRPRGPPGGRAQPRRHLPQVPRRSAGLRRGHPRHARRRRWRPRATRATRSTCSRSRSWPWWRMEPWAVDALFARGAAGGALRGAGRGVFEGVLDMLAGRYVVRRVRRAAPAPHLGPAGGHARRARGRAPGGGRQRRHHPGSRPLRRLPHRRRQGAARAWASSTRRWCSRAAWARRSCWARPPGASRRSPTTACSSRPRRASPGRCRSGAATPPGARSSSGRIIGELMRTPAPASPAAPRWSG